MVASIQSRGRLRASDWDDAFLPRVLAGDRHASRAFHEHYYPVAAAFLGKLGVQTPDVEDACQEVFLQVHRYLPRFRGEAMVKTWLYRLCITEARKVRRRRRIAGALCRIFKRDPLEATAPAATCTDHTLQAMVVQALDEMSESERLAFVLFEMEGLSGKEVAEITGATLPSVWRRVFEARQILKQALGIEEGGERS